MWFGLAKMALKTGANVYANKQKQKEAMSAAALLTAEKMARGETADSYTHQTLPTILLV